MIKSKIGSTEVVPQETAETNQPEGVLKNSLMREMELKLLSEIKDRAEKKSLHPVESPTESVMAVSSINHDPVAQLVSELSECLKLEEEEKAKVAAPSVFSNVLKKVEPLKKEKNDSNDSGVIIDFKSRLRKVDPNDKKPEEENGKGDDADYNKRESSGSSDNGKLDDNEDRRKSTGSINSLKKLWESKENSDNINNIQLSPKLALKNSKEEEAEAPDESLKKTEKKWPPPEEKPAIPVKPPLKIAKPLVSTKPTSSAIYATPIPANASTPKPAISAKPNLDKTPEEEAKKDAAKNEKESIMEISQLLESTLNSIKSNSNVSSTTWRQLSDKIGILHTSCMDYTNNVVPAHNKFQFRELLTKLETQARQLRSAGSRNNAENTQYLYDVHNTIKDVVNAVFR